jgi:DNA-directed RNA polymerase specialized sigma24 family protein
VVRNLVDLMRKVLIDHARRKLTQKRQHARVPMDSAIESLGKEGVNLLDFEDELRLLEQDGERGQQIALALKLRFFTGFSIQEIATMMECSTKQVGNLLRFGKRWIGNRVQHNHEDREER